ncbi:Zinc finger CCCH-type [Arabidopsis suecica]|uniref:Zinc finger CCCH-type n=1 Tax=Arabidopsis suecica TaxID=45249 RepID=A0A8T2H7S1_ARASU|nr:Zinc finger CCCH-type [Arabidopsis suecica]
MANVSFTFDSQEQNKELRPSRLVGRSDERNGRRQGTEQKKKEKEDSGFSVSEEGEIPLQQGSNTDSDARDDLTQQQRVSDVVMQRRSHETESRLWQRARTQYRRGSESRMMFDGRTQWSHAPVLSSAYPVRPGEDDCLFYMKNHLCEWGSECCYKHPPLQEIPCRIGKKLDCKAGACKRGSNCPFNHPKERDGDSLPMPQGRTPDLRRNDSGRRYNTESRSWPENKEKEVGQFRDHQDSKEDAQEVLLQQRPRDVEMRKRSRSPDFRAKTETKEHREAEERSSRESATATGVVSGKENELRPTYVYLLMMPENHNVDVQQTLQEQRKRNIKKARIEARLKLDQIRPTVVLENSRATKMMIEWGFTDFRKLQGSNLGNKKWICWVRKHCC